TGSASVPDSPGFPATAPAGRSSTGATSLGTSGSGADHGREILGLGGAGDGGLIHLRGELFQRVEALHVRCELGLLLAVVDRAGAERLHRSATGGERLGVERLTGARGLNLGAGRARREVGLEDDALGGLARLGGLDLDATPGGPRFATQ